MAITAAQVKELRDKSGAGMMDCKKALQETNGDVAEAMKYLREKGIASAGKRSGRTAKEGLIYSYIHPGSRVGVLIELNCETDFVARTDDFAALAKDLTMHIAASSPTCVAREDVPESEIETEREILKKQALDSGKPEQVIDKMVTGRLEKFFAQVCLLEQAFVKEMNQTVGEVVKEASGKLGENIVVRRFVRYQLGEESA